MNLGKAIKLKRIEKEISAKKFAKLIDVTAEFLSKLENDKAKPSWKLLSSIAVALETTVAFIIIKSFDENDFKEVDDVAGRHTGNGDVKFQLCRLLFEIDQKYKMSQ